MRVDLMSAAQEALAPRSTPPSKEMFLKLLVAQIKNQNPLDPADGAEFVAQLAQFSELEQMISIREDIGKMRELLSAPPQQGGE
ncbi:MAG: flagellar hook assembly protein FlgD [Bryobacteraceae bacterium]